MDFEPPGRTRHRGVYGGIIIIGGHIGRPILMTAAAQTDVAMALIFYTITQTCLNK